MSDRMIFIGLAFGVALLVAAGIGFSFYEHEHRGPAERIGETIDDVTGK